MEIWCPDCGAVYTISEQKIPGRAAKAVCRKCGAKILIQGPSADIRTPPKVPNSEPQESLPSYPGPTVSDKPISQGNKLSEFSVVSQSPTYPRYRDPLIIVVVILAFVGILAGVHFAARGTKNTLDRFFQDPIQTIANLILEPEKYELCASFLDRNASQLAVLGQNLKYYPIKEAVSTRNGQKTAAIVLRVQGTRATKDVAFQLQERKGNWEIVAVVMDLGRGKQQALYP
jgi:predicted Zn finger-like uncharacterized protein